MKDKRPPKYLHVSVLVGREDIKDEKTGLVLRGMPTRTPKGGGATARRAFPKPDRIGKLRRQQRAIQRGLDNV